MRNTVIPLLRSGVVRFILVLGAGVGLAFKLAWPVIQSQQTLQQAAKDAPGWWTMMQHPLADVCITMILLVFIAIGALPESRWRRLLKEPRFTILVIGGDHVQSLDDGAAVLRIKNTGGSTALNCGVFIDKMCSLSTGDLHLHESSAFSAVLPIHLKWVMPNASRSEYQDIPNNYKDYIAEVARPRTHTAPYFDFGEQPRPIQCPAWRWYLAEIVVASGGEKSLRDSIVVALGCTRDGPGSFLVQMFEWSRKRRDVIMHHVRASEEVIRRSGVAPPEIEYMGAQHVGQISPPFDLGGLLHESEEAIMRIGTDNFAEAYKALRAQEMRVMRIVHRAIENGLLREPFTQISGEGGILHDWQRMIRALTAAWPGEITPVDEVSDIQVTDITEGDDGPVVHFSPPERFQMWQEVACQTIRTILRHYVSSK